MRRGQPVEQPFERFGQCLIRRDPAGPQRVATKRRQQLGAEHRTERRGGQEGHVGVPHGVVAHVGDGGVEDQHFGLFRYVGVDRVDMQVAEIRRKPRLLLRVDGLASEEQYRVREQRLFNGVALLEVQRLGDVDATDLGAQCGT